MIKLPRPSLAWRPARTVITTALAIGLVVLLFTWRLGSPGSLSSAELSTRNTSNLSSLATNPFFAPWRLLQDAFAHINSHSVFLTRLPSVIFGLIFLLAFYYVLKGWFGKQIAYLGTILLATTPLYMLLSRIGLPAVMYFMPIAVLATHAILSRSRLTGRPAAALILACLVFCFYVPGLIWLLLAGLIIKWGQIRKSLGENSNLSIAILGIASLALISPLILSFIHHPDLIRTFFLIPEHFAGWLQTLKDWGWMLLALVLRAKQNEPVLLGQLPVLDAAQIGLGFFGAYVMWSRLRSQFYWLAGLLLFVCLLAGINSDYNVLAITLPLIAILVGMGLRYLFIEWMHIFPRNPLARYFAIALMAAVVFMHSVYGIRYCLVAWPAQMADKQVHMLK
jgi:hypothetical protein